MVLPVGMLSRASRLRTCVWTALWTSTIGDWADTVTDSSRAPTRISALMVEVKLVGSSTFSRRNVWKPGSVKVTT